MAQSHSTPADAPGFPARRIAAEILDSVLRRRRPLDELFDGKSAHPGLNALEERDRALVRRIVATVLRRLGTLRHLIGLFVVRGLPKDMPRVEDALLVGAVQILFLDVPDHAAVDLSVRLVQNDRKAARYSGLVNAVLRRVIREGKTRLNQLDTIALDTPSWLLARWTRTYGVELARKIAAAGGHEAPLDVSVKSDPQGWAARLGGGMLPTGSVRLNASGPVTALPGFDDGEWWVQDAAAALPAKLLGDMRGMKVADLCAAPGGKTAQLASAGANVTAVDRSEPRLRRLKENMARLKLAVETVTTDAATWQAGPFDAVLLDAPCSATGTIRRHPDIPWLKTERDLAALMALQHRLLDNAVALTRPGGTLVYCTCSLEPEEGEDAIAALLERRTDIRRRPVMPAEIGGLAQLLTPLGELRTLPCHLTAADSASGGMDGFFAARLDRL